MLKAQKEMMQMQEGKGQKTRVCTSCKRRCPSQFLASEAEQLSIEGQSKRESLRSSHQCRLIDRNSPEAESPPESILPATMCRCKWHHTYAGL